MMAFKASTMFMSVHDAVKIWVDKNPPGTCRARKDLFLELGHIAGREIVKSDHGPITNELERLGHGDTVYPGEGTILFSNTKAGGYCPDDTWIAAGGLPGMNRRKGYYVRVPAGSYHLVRHWETKATTRSLTMFKDGEATMSNETALQAAFAKAEEVKKSKPTFAELKDKAFEPISSGSKLGMVRLDKLNLDPRYQYDPETESGRKAALLQWLEANGGYDPDEHGPLYVNKRPDGTLWNMDGGGGAWMAVRVGLTKHLAQLFEYPTWEEEAAFFHRKNKHRRQVSNAHDFIAEANRGVEPNATIQRYVLAAKYQIERTKGSKGRVLSVPSLLFAFHIDSTGECLAKALYDLRNTLGDVAGVDGRLVVALSIINAAFRAPTDLLRAALRRDPTQSQEPTAEEAAKSLLLKAKQDASITLTSRLPQPRDANPYIVRELLRRMNYKRHAKNRFEYDPVRRLQDRFEATDQPWHDVWNWR